MAHHDAHAFMFFFFFFLFPVPSENWDDDFEFQQQRTTKTMAMNGTHDHHIEHRLSIASSDWDRDDNTTEHKGTYVPLADWAEPGPSTPSKHRGSHSTENWDDDFEDSPVRRAFPSPPRKDKLGLRRIYVPKTENWDEEFEGMSTPPKPSPSTSHKPHRHRDSRFASRGSNSSSEDDDGNLVGGGDDIGSEYAERDEEDRTVTARSRRVVLARLQTTPPPPVPTVPLPFLLDPHDTTSSPRPFPRSPTASVFSVPRPPSSSAYTVTSTTRLRPTLSRSSSSGLSALPPSPPIHRERRRLRKKSRPPGISDTRAREGRDGYETGRGICDTEFDKDRSCTPPPSSPLNGVNGTPAGANTSGTSSASGAGALLSRIGSVKKWAVRRKRGSTTPNEVLALGSSYLLSIITLFSNHVFLRRHQPSNPIAV